MVEFVNSISTKCAQITLIEKGILRVTLFQNSEIDLEESKAMQKAASEITKGQKYSALIDARVQVTLSSEAREWGSSVESLKDTIAQAILVESLANKLIGNFIIQFHKPIAKTKLFSNETLAIEWLREQKKNFKK